MPSLRLGVPTRVMTIRSIDYGPTRTYDVVTNAFRDNRLSEAFFRHLHSDPRGKAGKTALISMASSRPSETPSPELSPAR